MVAAVQVHLTDWISWTGVATVVVSVVAYTYFSFSGDAEEQLPPTESPLGPKDGELKDASSSKKLIGTEGKSPRSRELRMSREDDDAYASFAVLQP